MDTQTHARRLICFFDSGIGGLPLMAKCIKERPYFNYAYFADNYNVPYGNLPHERILSLVDEKFALMAKMDPAAAVVACNTVTAECISYLRQKYTFPVIGIQPAVKPAVTERGGCAVLCTPATAASAALSELVKKYGGNNTDIIPCPDLAAYIEDNIFALDERQIIPLLPETDRPSIVLGCTHYSYINSVISKFYARPIYDGIGGTLARIGEVVQNDWEIFGKFGKCPLGNSEVSFYGGNWLKNYRILQFLRQSEGA